MKERDFYYRLVNQVEQNGVARPKRHGQYISIEMFDGYKLELDTWNKSVYVYKNNKYIDSLGIDFGGFNCNLPMVKFWSAHLPSLN